MRETAATIEWNGHDLPEELTRVPPGRYRLVAVEADEERDLSPDDEAAIERGLADLREGRTIPLESVRAELARKYPGAVRG